MPLLIQIRGVENDPAAKWRWQVIADSGWKTEVLAKGTTMTADGAVYAAVMEARLHEPGFSPPPECLNTR